MIHERREGHERKRNQLLKRAKNQRAYIKRQDDHRRKCDDDVSRLEYLVSRLEGKRQGLLAQLELTRKFNEQRFQRIVREYVNVFQYGFSIYDTKRALQQENFLRSIMREYLSFYGQHSIEIFIQTFRRYCSSHGDFFMNFIEYEIVMNQKTGEIIYCGCQLKISQRLTRETLSMYYPHVLNDEVLVQKLIGRSMEARQVTQFYFDEEGFVEKLHTVMDLVPAFVALLGDVEAASRVTERHLLVPT